MTPGADSLSVVRVFAGYTVCVKSADWLGREPGAYVPPDSLLDTGRPEFALLAAGVNQRVRVKVRRLRGTHPCYDLEELRRYANVLTPGEPFDL